MASNTFANRLLYAFSLPAPLLDNFQPRQLHIPESHPLHPSARKAVEPPPATASNNLAIGGAFTCALTGASFPDLPSLREHYKTDWYKYNVKLRSQGKPTGVTEEQFSALVEDLSLSGSDSASTTSSASSSTSANAVSRLMRKQHLDRAGDDSAAADALDELGTPSGPRSALLWFEAPDVASGTQYGVYRAALPIAGRGKQRDDGPDALQELRQLQIEEAPSKGKGGRGGEANGGAPSEGKERKWTLLMFGGGHFAGMVVSLTPRLVSRGKGKEKEREVVVLQKKTFHRYTTRRKQGGSQAAFDAGNGKAKSAGALIRRHNEVALTEEVQALLLSWKEELDGSEIVFLRSSKTNHKTFFGYKDAPLDRKDPRIRGFSFPTRRPTISELLRAFTELTRVKISHLSADALAQLDASYLASITPAPPPTAPVPKPAPAKPSVPKLSKEEELERDRWTRLIDMVKKGKTDALAAFLDKYGPEIELVQGVRSGVWGALPDWLEESRTAPTLLHVASAADQSEMVKWLLVEKRADPTLAASDPARFALVERGSGTTDSPLALNAQLAITDSTTTTTATPSLLPTSSRPVLTPYELAPSRATRNVFRLLTTSNSDWWDWTGTGPTGARVPSGLTEEKEEERDKKGRERRGKLRDKLKEREKDREGKEREEREKEEKERAEKEEREREEMRRKGGNRVVPSGPKRLGGGPPRAMVVREMDSAGLTEEQRMRIQREQRARAAEARLGRTE